MSVREGSVDLGGPAIAGFLSEFMCSLVLIFHL